MKWITRERAQVDRVACPWLISRFLDPNPEFIYVPATKCWPKPQCERRRRMMWRVWSSDALLRKYGLEGKDSALDRVALIVRGADTAAKDLTPESRGLDAIAGGFQRMEISDPEELKWEFPLYDALYVYCGGRWPIPRPTEGV